MERHASLPINNIPPIDHNLFVSTVVSVFLCYIILSDLRRISVRRCGKELLTMEGSDSREG